MITRILEDRRHWTILMVVILALGSGWAILSRLPLAAAGNDERSAPRDGFSAPDFTLDLLGGGQVTLSELGGSGQSLGFLVPALPRRNASN